MAVSQTQYNALYLDPSQPVELRVDDLISRMTLEEKVGQLNMPALFIQDFGNSSEEKMIAAQQFSIGNFLDGLGPGGGFFALTNTFTKQDVREKVEFINALQRLVKEKTRLGIPLLQTEEGTHGFRCPGATIFPEGLALGSTFNTDLITSIYAADAKEARSLGIHQICTLVIEPVRDPRLGRNQEAYSEDPYQSARYAEAIVRGAQGDDVSNPDKCVTVLCHYPGQSQPVSGIERGAMHISERTLRSVFLPPWKAGITDAGALGVMVTYPSIDGIPAHASSWLLTDILRGELGFKGVSLSEGDGFATIIYEGLAPDQKHAGQMSLKAGVDVNITYESAYMLDLIESVREGAIPESLVDRALRRVLELKFRLGLFENPYADPEHAIKSVHCDEHEELALNAAREGIVLFKNQDNLLPLDRNKIKSIAVIGPNADDVGNQLGDYHADTLLQDITTVLDGVKQIAPHADVTFVKGCLVKGADLNEIDKARDAAAAADVAIVVVGENDWGKWDENGNRTGTVGEGMDAATLELTGLQKELVKSVAGTGTPCIVVLINGRPLATPWIAEHIPAVIEAWIPGEKGGQAVAEVIFGDVNPSGVLPVTVPRHSGQLPVYYNYPKSKRYWLEKGWGVAYTDLDPSPLYAFGHGLSYTSFEYGNLRMDKTIGVGGTAQITVDVKNTGDRAGKHTVQLYIEDLIASVETPVKELKGFQKISLEPGETRTVTFELGPEELALYNRHVEYVVEPGEFKIMIGAASDDIRASDILTVK